MTIESERDLKKLQKIGKIVALTLRVMARSARPGMTTRELDAIGAAVLQKHGARSAPMLAYNFPGATCISINDEAAHGIPGERVIQADDLVNIDVSAELEGYFADTAVMVVMPEAGPLKRKLADCTRVALQRGMHAARAGRPINAIAQAVQGEARRCGFSVLSDLSGHGVGRAIHEEPQAVANVYNPLDFRKLSDGLVITIEPFLTTGARETRTLSDGWTLKTMDGSLSAQYEHTIVVTRGQPLVITAL